MRILFTLTLLLITILKVTSQEQNLYDILELKRDASEDDIKKQFRKLSAKLHPDKNPGDAEKHKKYLDVMRAYEILSDQEKRQIYDLYGEEGLKNKDISVWGKQQNKGPNARSTIQVTLEDLYNGAVKEFTISRNVICPHCRGTGDKDGKLKVCKHCGGKGVRMQNVQMGVGFTIQTQTTCDRCGGKGKIGGNNCPICAGNRVVPEQKKLTIQIEKGMKDQDDIVFKGEAEQSPDYSPGDLIFSLKQIKHNTFQRAGDELYAELKLDLQDAILGFSKKIKHLDDHYVEVNSNQVVQPFQIKKIAGEGMPMHQFPSQKGNLYITHHVKLPSKLSQKQKDIAKKIFDMDKNK